MSSLQFEPPFARARQIALEAALKEPAVQQPEPPANVSEALKQKEPVAEEPVAEEPVVEEPVAEEPVAEEPVAEEPVAEEPVAEEPVAEEPVAEEPRWEPSMLKGELLAIALDLGLDLPEKPLRADIIKALEEQP